MGLNAYIERINTSFGDSRVGKYFKVKERNSTFFQELRGGTTTFLTCAYILAVNASIVAQTGGPCPTNGACPKGPGSLGDPDCQSCVADVKKSLISATAASCIISHFLMGVVANLPLACAPGMGLNAYFTFTVVGFMGTGLVTYQQALAAVFIEGFIFVAIALLGVRGKLVEYIPRCVMLATSAGIGMFLAFIGLQAAEGVGVVTYNQATLVTLGGCPPEYRSYQFTFSEDQLAGACTIVNGSAVPDQNSPGWIPSGSYSCASAGVLRSAQTWLGILGGAMVMCILLAKGVKGAVIIGIAFVTVISWIPTSSNKAAWIGQYAGPGGEDRLDYFKKVVAVPDTSATAAQFDFSGFTSGDLWLALIVFLYVDFLDATGTFCAMANFLSLHIPGFVDEKTKKFDRQLAAFTVDGISISAGAVLGTSPLTVYVESASGINEGARTGLAALAISFWFFVALWFTPLLATIPPYATGPALILVGSMMMINIVKINWGSVLEAAPAFATIVLMPLTYSIANGVIAGILIWILLHSVVFTWDWVQYKLFPQTIPKEADPNQATWRIVRQYTFHVSDEDLAGAKEGDASVGKGDTLGDISVHSIVKDSPSSGADPETSPAADKV